MELKIDISVVPFKHKLLPLLLEMHKTQSYVGIDNITMQTLPRLGFMALLGEHPIAAGFLRRVEPCYAQIDTLVSNAHFGSKIRHAGISQVVDALLLEAKALKLNGIISFTSDDGVIKRAKELNFHVVEQKIIALSL